MSVKVSIIVPIYNVEKYLDRCMKSLLNQTLKEIEIIMVDDESPDHCPQMCDDYATCDHRIKVIHKKNEGLGYARNSGLEIATGEYVTFLDSDDFVDKVTYQMLYNKVKEKNLEICYFKHCRYLSPSAIYPSQCSDTETYFLNRKDVDQFLLNMVGPSPETAIDEMYSMSTCMAIYKRSIIVDNGIRFVSEREIASEDLVFHLHLLPYINRIGYLPNIYYYYYINTSSITSTYSVAKYNRLINLAEVVKQELDILYDERQYKMHYIAQLLRIYKVIMKFESKANKSFLNKLKRIREICEHPLLDILYNTDISKFRIKNKCLIICMKYKLAWLIILTYKHKQIK